MRKAVATSLAAGSLITFLCFFLIAGSAAVSNADACSPPHQPNDGATQSSEAVVQLGPEGPQSSARWNASQRRNAATITDVARTRSLPPRAAVISVTTAIQESRLDNLEGGDRDSVGLFQQRPSQGWGSKAELTDPVYAAGRFYDTLLTVDDWQTRPLAEVAQSVQRSGHPEAYAKWEEAAGVLVAETWGATVVSLASTACAEHGTTEDFDVQNPRSPAEAIAAARRAEGQTGWYRMCDAFVAQAYGYLNSGSHTANEHWNRLVAAGLAHSDDHSPPPGALLFYDTGQAAGHVALYLGDDLVASNDILDSYPGEGRIAIVHRDDLTDGTWHLRYRGWTEPSFPGAGGASTI